MNAKELYIAYGKLAGGASQAHLPVARFAQFYWVCLVDYIRWLATEPISELQRSGLRNFREVAKFDQGGSRLAIGSIKPAMLVVRAVRADFGPHRLDTPVQPVDSDSLGERQADPFRRGSVDEPLYAEEEAGFLTIYAGVEPTAVRIPYLRYPEKVDYTNSSIRNESEDVQYAVLRRVLKESDLIDEKYNRYSALSRGEIPQTEKVV